MQVPAVTGNACSEREFGSRLCGDAAYSAGRNSVEDALQSTGFPPVGCEMPSLAESAQRSMDELCSAVHARKAVKTLTDLTKKQKWRVLQQITNHQPNIPAASRMTHLLATPTWNRPRRRRRSLIRHHGVPGAHRAVHRVDELRHHREVAADE